MTTEGPRLVERYYNKFSMVVGIRNIGYLIIFTNPCLWPVIIDTGNRECIVMFVTVYYWHLVCECRLQLPLTIYKWHYLLRTSLHPSLR